MPPIWTGWQRFKVRIFRGKTEHWEQSWYGHLTFAYDLAIMAVSCGCDAVVAYLLPKQTVVGSNPITRSTEGAPGNWSPFLVQFPEDSPRVVPSGYAIVKTPRARL